MYPANLEERALIDQRLDWNASGLRISGGDYVHKRLFNEMKYGIKGKKEEYEEKRG